jgi:ankyrin repeat protein
VSTEKLGQEIQFEAEVQKLIQSKKDINQAKKDGFFILCWAVEHDYADAVKMLLEHEADPNGTLMKGATETALFPTVKALSFVDTPNQSQKIHTSRLIAEMLIEHGADVNHASLIKKTPLIQAAITGRADLCELFIQKGAKLGATDVLGNTPLHEAANNGYWEATQVLLQNGARADVKNKLGKTALDLANKRSEEATDREVRKIDKGYRPGADYDKTIEAFSQYAAP